MIVTINGHAVTQAELDNWESARATAVLKKFNTRLGARAVAELLPDVSAPTSSDLDTKRNALLTLKTRLGHAGIYAMIKHELALSDRVARLAVAVSRGRTSHSVTRLVAPGVRAAEFEKWFDDLTATNAEADMIAACPDHYLLRGLPDGRQEVVETTGGSPTATRFIVDYTDTSTLSIPVDPDYPVQIAGRAVLDDGLVIGGVRHQFRDRDGAMEALLTVEFPKAFPPNMIAAHRWHLGVEFGNWVRASAKAATA